MERTGSASTGDIIRCQCGNVLGKLVAGQFHLRHRGRELIGPIPFGITCEDCGRTWTPQQQGSSAA